MKRIVNTLIFLGVIACMVCGVMLQDWTGLKVGGFLAIPAGLLLFLYLERTDSLPKWMK